MTKSIRSLIDEARTPLIISGPVEESTDLYQKINKLIPKLRQHREPENPANYDINAATVLLRDEKGKPIEVDADGEEEAASEPGIMSIDAAVQIAETA